MSHAWKDKLNLLLQRRELYGPERKQIRLCLSNPLANEKTYQIYVETFERRLSTRASVPTIIERKQETMTCGKCGVSFDAEALYIYGHRQTRDVCPACYRKERELERLDQAAKLEAKISDTRSQWRHSSGIPPRYQSERFSTFEGRPGTNEAVQASLGYAENLPLLPIAGERPPSLLLYSDDVWGNGKTHLACSVAHTLIDRWQGEEIACPVCFVSEPEIYSRIQETYSFSAEEKQHRMSEQQIIGRFVAVRLLVIDDLGKQVRRDMDFVRRTLFEIFNRRYNALRPVLVTSNKNAEGLREYLGADEAVLDRLIEMTEGHRVKVTAKSFRRRRP